MADKISYKKVLPDGFGDGIEIILRNTPTDIMSEFATRWDIRLKFEKVMWNIGDTRAGLRYGDNPEQPAALFRLVGVEGASPKDEKDLMNEAMINGAMIKPGEGLTSDAELLQAGKHPGLTNVTDIDKALDAMQYLMANPTVMIMKHNNPCGAAQGADITEAYLRADKADRLAAFGGTIVLNRPVGEIVSEEIVKRYSEVVAAPDFSPEALEVLGTRPDIRLFRLPGIANLAQRSGRRRLCFRGNADGSIILQMSQVLKDPRPDYKRPSKKKGDITYMTDRDPTDSEWADAWFGLAVEQAVNSNSVLYVKDCVTLGIGTGGQDRVGVAKDAADRAYEKATDYECFMRTGGIPINDLRELIFRYDHGMDVQGYIAMKSEEWKAGSKLTGIQPDKIMETASSIANAVDIEAEAEDMVEEKKAGLKGAVTISDGLFPFDDGVLVGLREGVSFVVQPGGSVNDHQVIAAVRDHGAAMVFTNQRYFRH